jgi:hypothetical protein
MYLAKWPDNRIHPHGKMHRSFLALLIVTGDAKRHV